MEVVTLKLGDITPYDKNPRNNTPAIEIVKQSIKENGYNQYILVNQDNIICVGHTRYQALLELGYKEIPVFRKQIDQKEFIRYNIADNKTSEYSTWEFDILADLMQDYSDMGGTFEGTGFDANSFQSLLDSSDIDSLADDIEVPTKAGSAPREQIKQVQIYLNDLTFPKFISMCEVIQADLQAENLNDTVYKAIEKLHDTIINSQRSKQ